MVPQRTYTASIDKPSSLDLCGTPPHALPPIIRYLPKNWCVWDPGCGKDGLLANALRVAGYKTIETDILFGQNFFDDSSIPDYPWNVIVTNPPYGIKPAWLQRCYELGKPFALLMPTSFQATEGGAEQFDQYGIDIINLYPRVAFKMPIQGWYSTPQFPVSWYVYGSYNPYSSEKYFPIHIPDLSFSKLDIPKRDIFKIVTNPVTGNSRKVWGWGDWIEKPKSFENGRFIYD